MPVYEIEVKKQVEKALAKAPTKIAQRVHDFIPTLAANPKQGKKLKGFDDLYRERFGDYRLMWRVDDGRLIVIVLKFGPRGGFY